MLKHKIRKSRKNILSLLESGEKSGETHDNGYSKVNKKLKKKKEKELTQDEGYYTTVEKKQEEKRIPMRKSETRYEGVQIVDRSTQSPEQYSYESWRFVVPVVVAFPCQRRSSPVEDLLWTQTGLKNLLSQQRQLLQEIQERERNKKGNHEEDKDNRKGGTNIEGRTSGSMYGIKRIMEIEKLKKFSESIGPWIDQL